VPVTLGLLPVQFKGYLQAETKNYIMSLYKFKMAKKIKLNIIDAG
jgi:hypothetical protein